MSAPERAEGTVMISAELLALLLETHRAALSLAEVVDDPKRPHAALTISALNVAGHAREFEKSMEEAWARITDTPDAVDISGGEGDE